MASDLEFIQKLNKARHDQNFQICLALSFGERFLVREGTVGMVVYRWRGITYVTQEFQGLPPSPPTVTPYPIDL